MGRGRYIRLKIKDLAKSIVTRQSRKWDCIICFTGERGSGKSTGAIRLAKAISKINKQRFSIKKDVIYTRTEMMEKLSQYHKIIVADEALNAAFKRDFYVSEQKDLIKILMMYRDHGNILIMALPNFFDLDKPMRDLIKIRFDIRERGMALMHMPQKSFYKNDPWDCDYNRKVEENWIKKGISKPHFNKLTTFKGIVTYKALPEKLETLYQQVKDEKRIMILDIKKEKTDKQTEFYRNAAKLLLEGKMEESQVNSFASLCGVDKTKFIINVTKILRSEMKRTETAGQLMKKVKKEKAMTHAIDRFGFPMPKPTEIIV
jgi:hypothetical protein